MNQNKISKNHAFPKVNVANILKRKVLTDILFPTTECILKYTFVFACVYTYINIPIHINKYIQIYCF